MQHWQLWLIPLLAFLLGSIPFGLLIARAKGVDIRQHGSGNIGATNVLRTIGKKEGITCLVLDALKGLVPTLLGLSLIRYTNEPNGMAIQALIPHADVLATLPLSARSPISGSDCATSTLLSAKWTKSASVASQRRCPGGLTRCLYWSAARGALDAEVEHWPEVGADGAAGERRREPQPAVQAAGRDAAEVRADVAAVRGARAIPEEQPAQDRRLQLLAHQS